MRAGTNSTLLNCWNEKDEVVPRDRAKWCVPLVEFETLSVDEQGRPVPPNRASFISRKDYGPNHTFIGSASTPPVRVPPSEFRAPRAEPPTYRPEPQKDGFPAYHRLPVERIGWWEKVKGWIGRA